MSEDGRAGFGALLRRLRHDAGLTQEALAERAGVSARGISDLERGVNRTAQRETARLLADALGLTGDERSRFLAATRGRPEPMGPRPPSLPLPPTPLVGREQESTRLHALLAWPDVRLVTLTGAGGVGKTRLAIEAAARAAGDFPGGVHFVDLAPLPDPGLVAGAIAGVLGVLERPGQSLIDALAGALSGGRTLLVLDNFEHLLRAAPLVATLLSGSAAATFLVTSRAPLRLRPEHVFPVPPLPVPVSDNGATLETLAHNESVALFTQRAQAAAGFALGANNAVAVAELVRRLDGVPLAIELAAARTPILSPSAMIARLDNPLALLAGGPRDLPPRQQTLRDTLDWSYHLLEPPEQRLFRQAAVFAGGATLDAIAAVADAQGRAILDGVGALVGWGLLRVETPRDGEPRYAMLETMREYASGRLLACGEADAAHAAHARYFVQLAAFVDPEGAGGGQAGWLARFDAERDNVRAALRWLIAHDAAACLRLSASLWWYWDSRGAFAEGLGWLERALAAGAGADAEPRARAHAVAGELAYRLRELDRAERHLAQALAIRRERGDERGSAWALALFGLVAVARGEPELAETYQRQALAGATAAGDDRLIVGVLANLGEALHLQGDLSHAERLYAESLAAARAVGNELHAAGAMTNLAVAAGETGRHGRAVALHRDALRAYFALGARLGIAASLEGLAAAAAAMGNAEQSAWLYGAASALRDALGSPVPTIAEAVHGRGITAARSSLGAHAFAQAFAAGRTSELDEVVAEALEEGFQTDAELFA